MTQLLSPTLPLETVADLEISILAEGFVPGTPPTLKADSRLIDSAMCKRMRCPVCRKAGMNYRPFHKRDRFTGQSRYRVLAVCNCGHGEEL
jgi:hypothetical protein